MPPQIPKTVAISLVLIGLMASTLAAALTPAQRKDLKEIGTDAAKVTQLIAKKKYNEASTAIKDVEDRLASFISDTGLKEKDPVLKPVRNQIDKVKNQLTKATEKVVGEFEKHVASIVAQKCLECHGENAKGGLRLDTFAGLEKGGKSGILAVAGDPESSLLIQRLMNPNPELRMPLGADQLPENEILAIANWISDGAVFEGDKTAMMADLAKSATTKKPAAVGFGKPIDFGKKPAKPEVSKATGKETVHFMEDVMPEMVNVCGQCHNDTAKRSGFSVTSFEKLMKGGDSGAVIVPGSPETSRLWRLVNADDTPVMPAGNQLRITRKWHANLKTWITEGAKFDGVDPKKPFPSQQEREAAALAKITPAEALERRKKASEEAWKKTLPNTTPNRLETPEFLFYGDVASERLKQCERWAKEQTASLRQLYRIKDESLWRGKLAIFVFKDRFGYEEFNNSIHRREVPREVLGHSQVTSMMEDAFIAIQDIGDGMSDSSPGMQVNVIEHVTEAFFQRGGKLPDWLIHGAGLALAHQKAAANPYFASMPRRASQVLRDSNLPGPEKIFEDGTFAPADVGPVGCTLVQFLLRQGDFSQFGQLVHAIQTGTKPDAAVMTVYQTDCKAFVAAYMESLPASGGKNSE